MTKAKRPRIKRLDWPFATRDHGADFIKAARHPRHDLPIFPQDGWYLRIEGKKIDTWYQVQGSAFAPTGRYKSVERAHKDAISLFKHVLNRLNAEENDIGVEAAAKLTGLSLTLPQCYQPAIAVPVYEHRVSQERKDSRRELQRVLRSVQREVK